MRLPIASIITVTLCACTVQGGDDPTTPTPAATAEGAPGIGAPTAPTGKSPSVPAGPTETLSSKRKVSPPTPPSGLPSPPALSGRVLQNVLTGRCLANLPSVGSCAPYTSASRVAAFSLKPFHASVTSPKSYPLTNALVELIPGLEDTAACAEHSPGTLDVSIFGCVEYIDAPLSVAQEVGSNYVTLAEQDVPGTPADESTNGCLADKGGKWVTIPASSCDAVPEAHWIWIN